MAIIGMGSQNDAAALENEFELWCDTRGFAEGYFTLTRTEGNEFETNIDDIEEINGLLDFICIDAEFVTL